VFSEKSLIADAALTLNISDTKYYGQSNDLSRLFINVMKNGIHSHKLYNCRYL